MAGDRRQLAIPLALEMAHLRRREAVVVVVPEAGCSDTNDCVGGCALGSAGVRIQDDSGVPVALAGQHGHQACKKVVVIKSLDEGTKERSYPHVIVAGIERYPRKATNG